MTQLFFVLSYSILIWLSNVKVTRSSFNFRFTPDDGLWFRPKYRITLNITLFIQPLPLLQLLSGSNRKKLSTYIRICTCRKLLYGNNIINYYIKIYLLPNELTNVSRFIKFEVLYFLIISQCFNKTFFKIF